ncbi:MAG: 3-dehydroquinate synthase [Bacteroidetes bacterium]|nr:3-dehydroquinate synthase [Bacteroidota bacterium]
MKVKTPFSTLVISLETDKVLSKILETYLTQNLFILVDENTKKFCLPKIENAIRKFDSVIIEIESGEKNKSIKTVEKVWQILTQKGADRHSVLLNLGGGIIGDLGGFAASTFKRGMDFMNIPTTLLSQVDASIGGKTGVNFLGLKNEIGVFNHPKYVIIDSSFNQTLDKRNIMSGWAEMLKHTLISDEKDWDFLIKHDIKKTGYKELNHLIDRSIKIKNRFVEEDPNEKGIRKALNFGHTFGHAFESLFMNTPKELLHGEAVAQGMICELYLSHKLTGFPIEKMNPIVHYLTETFSKPKISKSDFKKLSEFIKHDKKNEGGTINLTLLEDFGKIKINSHCTEEDILDTLIWHTSI